MFILFSTILTLLLLLKIYVKLTCGWCYSQRCLVGKTAIVTGANTGIGFATALDFAKRGAKVILACRNFEKAEEARRQIIEKTDNEKVFVKIIDMSSFNSVRLFAKDIIEHEERLDILVNNAGVAHLLDEKTEDGYTLGMQVNYFSMFLLTNLLLDLMKKTRSSRIVNVSSILARAAFNFKIDQLYSFPGIARSYWRTKFCIILFTKELAKRLGDTSVTTYSLHPGAVQTEIFNHCGLLFGVITIPIKDWFSKTWEEGAQTTIHCSVEKGIEKYNGCHFEDCRRVADYHKFSLKLSKDLWEETEKVVGLKA